ncbi:MAG: ABC transporter permease subunit [Oscillospiraceae bacterium]|nr:ABC transporter permease subunit [Oscillospiraceae bacterium]
MANKKNLGIQYKKLSLGYRIKRDATKNYTLYLMMLPVLVYYIIFHYGPMVGLQTAFRDTRIITDMWTAPWVGFANFRAFFNHPWFGMILGNTIRISLWTIIAGFPAPIILALLINELKSKKFSRVTQTITYLPHFISLVVVAGMVITFVSAGSGGIISQAWAFITRTEPQYMLNNPSMFLPIFVTTNIWRTIGWGSIVYLAALTGIDPTLYEAAEIDGASRMRKLWHVTLPGILPTITIMLILRVGQVMTVGFEEILLLQNQLNFHVSEVIPTHMFNRNFGNTDWGITREHTGYTSAIAMFNSVINFAIIIVANFICRKVGETSLW